MYQLSRKKGKRKSENATNDTLYLQQSLIDKEAVITKQAEDLKKKNKYLSAFKKLSFATNSNICNASVPPYERIENIRDQLVLQTLSNSNKSLESKCETLNAKVKTLENELSNRECIILKHELVIKQYSKIIEEDKITVEDSRNDLHKQKIVCLQLERKCAEVRKWARRLGKIIEKHEIPLSKADTTLLRKIQQQPKDNAFLKTCSLEVDKEDIIKSSDAAEDHLPESKILKNQETQTLELIPNSLIGKDHRKLATYTNGLGILSPSLTNESVGLSPGLSVSGLSPVSLDDCTHFKDSFQTYGPLDKETMPANEDHTNGLNGLSKEDCLDDADCSPASPATSVFDPEVIDNMSLNSDADSDEGISNENIDDMLDDASQKSNMPVFDELNSSINDVESSVVNDCVSTANVDEDDKEVLVEENELLSSNDLLSQEIIHEDNKYIEVLRYRDHFEVVIHCEEPEKLDGESKNCYGENNCIQSEVSDKLEYNENKLSEEPDKSISVSEKLENAIPICESSDNFDRVLPVTKELSTASPMTNRIIKVNDEIDQAETAIEAIEDREILNITDSKETDIILAQIGDESNVSLDIANDAGLKEMSSLQNNSNYQLCSEEHSYAAIERWDGENEKNQISLIDEQISKTDIVEADRCKEETKPRRNLISNDDKMELLSIPHSLSEHKVDNIDEGAFEPVNAGAFEPVNAETIQLECSRQDSPTSSCASSDSMISVEDNYVSTRKHHSNNESKIQSISEILETEKTPQSKSKCTDKNISCLGSSNKHARSPLTPSSPEINHNLVERQTTPQKSIFDHLEHDSVRDTNLSVNLHSPCESLDFEDDSSDVEHRSTHSESDKNCNTEPFNTPEPSKQVLDPDNASEDEHSKAKRKIKIVDDKVLDKIMRRMQIKSILKGHIISPIPPSPQTSKQGPSIQMELSMLSSDEEKNSAATDPENSTKSIQKEGNPSTAKKDNFRRLRGVCYPTEDKSVVPVRKCVAGDLSHNAGSNLTEEFNFKKPRSVLGLNKLSAGIPIHSEKESKRSEDAIKGSPGCSKPNHSIRENSSIVEKSHSPKHCGTIEVKNIGKQENIVSTRSVDHDENVNSIDSTFKSSQSSDFSLSNESQTSKLFNNSFESSCLENPNHSLVDHKTFNEVSSTDNIAVKDVEPTPEQSEGDHSTISSEFGSFDSSLIECDFEKFLNEIRAEFHVPDCIDKLSDSDSSSDTLEMESAQLNDFKETLTTNITDKYQISLEESTQAKSLTIDQSPIASQCCKIEDSVERMCEKHNSILSTTVIDLHSNNSQDLDSNPSKNLSLLEDNPKENLKSKTSCISNKTCTNGSRIRSEKLDSSQSWNESAHISNPPIPFHDFEHRESNPYEKNIASLPVSNNLPESDKSYFLCSLPNFDQYITVDNFQQCTPNSFERSIEKRPVYNNILDESSFKGSVSNGHVNKIDSVQPSDEVAHSSCKFVAVNSFEYCTTDSSEKSIENLSVSQNLSDSDESDFNGWVCTSNSSEKNIENPTVLQNLSDSDESDFKGWVCTSNSSEKNIENTTVLQNLSDSDESDFKGWVCTSNSSEKNIENPTVLQNLSDSDESDFKGWDANEQVKKIDAIHFNDRGAQSSIQTCEKAQNKTKNRCVNSKEIIQSPLRRSARVLERNGNDRILSLPSCSSGIEKLNLSDNSKHKMSENTNAANKVISSAKVTKYRISNQVETGISRTKETPKYSNTRSRSLPNTFYCIITRRRSLLMNSCSENADQIEMKNSKSNTSVARVICEDTSPLQRSSSVGEVNCSPTEKVESEVANGFRNALKSKNENLCGKPTRRRSHPIYSNYNRKYRRRKIDEIKTLSGCKDGRKSMEDHINSLFGELNISADGNKNQESPSVSNEFKSENLNYCFNKQLASGKTPESNYVECERPSCVLAKDLKDFHQSSPLHSKYSTNDNAYSSKNSEEFSSSADRMIVDNYIDDHDYSDDVLLIDCQENSKDENQGNLSNSTDIPSRNDDEMKNGVISMQNNNCYDLNNSTTVCRKEDQRHIPVIGIEQRKSLRLSTINASQNSDLIYNLKIDPVPNLIDVSAKSQNTNIKTNCPSHKSATDFIEKFPTLNFYSEVSEATADILSEQSDKRKSGKCDSPVIGAKRRKIIEEEDPHCSETISLDPNHWKNMNVSKRIKTEEIRMVQCDNVITMAYQYHRKDLYSGNGVGNSMLDESYPEEGFEKHNQLVEELFIRVATSSLEEDESFKEEKDNVEYWTNELLETCLEKLKGIPNNVISDVIIDTLYTDEDDPDIDAAAPLSDLQKKVITITFKLCSSRPKFFNSLLMAFRKLLLNAEKETVTRYCNYVRFLTVLCRALGKLEEMRWFVYDVLYLKKMSGLPMAYTALVMWPSLLPMASPIETACPLALCISHVLLNHNIKSISGRLYKTSRIENLLKLYYGYSDTSPDVVFNHLMKKIDIEGALEAVALLCKRIGPKWTLTFVVEGTLLPILNEWKMKKNSEAVVHAIGILSYVLRPFLQGTNNAKLNDVLRKIGTFLSDPEADDRIQAAAAEGLCRLSKGNMPLCTELLIKWKPRSGMVPVQLIKQMRAFISRRKPVRWLEVMARNNLIKP